MRGRLLGVSLCLIVVAGIFGLAHSTNVALADGPSSTWTMESGIRLEGGWPSNPSVVSFGGGNYRMYFADMLLDYYPLGSIVKSAVSTDGLTWTIEDGVRVGFGSGGEMGHASSQKVVVLGGGTFRMYYCHFWSVGPDEYRSQILSCVSMDGLTWTQEPGVRVDYGGIYDSRYIEGIETIGLSSGLRMYYSGWDGSHYRILSAVSADGLTFTKEPGVRIDVGGPYDPLHAVDPQILRVPDGRYIMFYCGYPAEFVGQILSAVSTDGLAFTKESGVRIPAGSYSIVTPSDLVRLSGYEYRMYITADRYPVWDNRTRILSALGIISYPAGVVGGYSVALDAPSSANVVAYGMIVAAVAIVASLKNRWKRKTYCKDD